MSLWRHRGFLRLWTGETFSWFGESIGNFAIPVIAISVLGADEIQVGLLNAFGTLAFLVIGLPAGAWVDRWLKRRTMLRVDLFRAIILLVVPVLWLLGVLEFWHLLVAATAVGALSVFFDVSYQSYVPILVCRDQVADANGKLETSAQIARIAGPAAGGGLIAILAAPLALFVTAATYLLSFVALLGIRDEERPRPKEDRRPLAVEIGEGLRFVFGHRLLRRVVATTALSNFFGTMVFTLLPLLVLRDLGIPEWLYGVMSSLGAVGGVTGALLASRISRWIGEGTVIPVSAIALAVFGFLVPLAIAAPGGAVALLVAFEFVGMACIVLYNVAQVSFRQRITPEPLLGRMNASIRFVVWGVVPIGAMLAGLLATWIGMTATIWIGTVGGLLAVIPVLLSPLTGMRRLPDAPSA